MATDETQWGVFVRGMLVNTCRTEAAARNDPASLRGYVRVRSTVWVHDSYTFGPWQATDPDDPLWGGRGTPVPIGLVHAGRDLLALGIFIAALVLIVGGLLWLLISQTAA